MAATIESRVGYVRLGACVLGARGNPEPGQGEGANTKGLHRPLKPDMADRVALSLLLPRLNIAILEYKNIGIY